MIPAGTVERGGRRRRPMMRLTIYSVAIVALIAVATFMLRPPSPSIELSAAAMPPLQELHAMAGVHQLPVQDIEDQWLTIQRWRSTKNEAKPLVIDGLIFKSRFKLLGDVAICGFEFGWARVRAPVV